MQAESRREPRWCDDSRRRACATMDRRAYVLTAVALLLWSTLAVGAAVLAGRSPLVVAGFGLLLGGLLTAPRWREWEVPTPIRLLGVGGILGYHLLFFSAFAYAPKVAVNLINYLWPLLLVILAPVILPKTAWSWRHTCAALAGLAGCACLFFPGGESLRDGGTGYALAAGAALVWALYSLLTKRAKPFATTAVGGFCVVSGAIALGIAAALGTLMPTVRSLAPWEWLIIAGMGIGPLGIAFLCWDAALKRGDPLVIGTLAYLTPLLSTAWLLLLDQRQPGWHQLAALTLIVSGAVIGATAPSRARRSTVQTRKVTTQVRKPDAQLQKSGSPEVRKSRGSKS